MDTTESTSSRSKRQGGRHGARRTLVAIDRRGSRVQGVVLDAHDAGAPRIVETLDATDTDIAQRIAGTAADATLVLLIPGDEATCRGVSSPEGPREEAIAALELECEADFADIAPAHRRSVGMLPGAMSGVAVLTCWPGADAPVDRAGVSLTQARCVPVVAALAALVTTNGWAYAYDRDQGWIASVDASAEKPTVRVFIEDPTDSRAWSAALDRVRESLGAGAEPGSASSRVIRLDVASMAALERIAPRASDASWLNNHALALGAAIIAGSSSPSVRAIASLRASRPKEAIPPHVRLARWVSVPRNAVVTIVAALLVLAMAPIGLAWARYSILAQKSEGLDSGRVEREQLMVQSAMFTDVEKSRWPMTKLISDISRATPVGVDVESLRLAPDSGVSIQGTATSMDLVNQLESNLTGSGVFAGVKVNRTTATGAGVEFDVSASVRSPHAPAKIAEDFAAKPLVSREGFVMPTLPPPRATRANGSSSNGSSSASTRPNTSEGTSTPASRRPVADNNEAPGALTDDAISKLTSGQAMIEWAKRKSYLQKNPDTDGTTRQRVQDEITKLEARREELRKGGA